MIWLTFWGKQYTVSAALKIFLPMAFGLTCWGIGWTPATSSNQKEPQSQDQKDQRRTGGKTTQSTNSVWLKTNRQISLDHGWLRESSFSLSPWPQPSFSSENVICTGLWKRRGLDFKRRCSPHPSFCSLELRTFLHSYNSKLIQPHGAKAVRRFFRGHLFNSNSHHLWWSPALSSSVLVNLWKRFSKSSISQQKQLQSHPMGVLTLSYPDRCLGRHLCFGLQWLGDFSAEHLFEKNNQNSLVSVGLQKIPCPIK